MRKNVQIQLRIETNLLNVLKKEAIEAGVTISEICRHKMESPYQLTRIESRLSEIVRVLNTQLNTKQEVNMVTKTREIQPIDPKKYKTCELCGKYIVGDVCYECADGEENEESQEED